MRQMISGFVAAIAVVAASAAPAMACGWYGGSCYGPAYTYWGCYGGCAGWAAFERLPDPVQQYHAPYYSGPQYYYVNQGPTYTGPGNFAPYPIYQESAVSSFAAYRHRPARVHRGPVLRRYY